MFATPASADQPELFASFISPRSTHLNPPKRCTLKNPSSAIAIPTAPATIEARSAVLPPDSASKLIPISVNVNCVTTCSSMSTSTVAPASPPGIPWNVMRRAPAISPPICATGSSVLIASRTKRTLTHVVSVGLEPGNMHHHPIPAPAISTARSKTTTAKPHPTVVKASATAAKPS